jgi:N-acetylneuraminate synthase
VFTARHRGVVMPKQTKTSNSPSEYGVKVIAEITTNHFGDMDRLKSMIVAAKQAGADYIKLQKRDVESFYSNENWTHRTIPLSVPLSVSIAMALNSIESNLPLSIPSVKIGIGWFASILDMPSYDFIRQFDPDMIKLPSTISEHKDYWRPLLLTLPKMW